MQIKGMIINTASVYAHNQESLRVNLYEQIKDLSKVIMQPCLVLGDFNAVLNTNENKGGKKFRVAQIKDFNNFSTCNLDLRNFSHWL